MCSDADNGAASPAESAETQASTSSSLFTAAPCFGAYGTHLTHGFGIASLVTDDVTRRETESAYKDDDAGADDPGKEGGANFLNQGTLLARLLRSMTVSAVASNACYSRAGFAFGLVGGTAARGAGRRPVAKFLSDLAQCY